ncbi:MAG TPA: hypothetical protein VGH66_04850, partial [Acidimicrobiales bacterium]
MTTQPFASEQPESKASPSPEATPTEAVEGGAEIVDPTGAAAGSAAESSALGAGDDADDDEIVGEAEPGGSPAADAAVEAKPGEPPVGGDATAEAASDAKAPGGKKGRSRKSKRWVPTPVRRLIKLLLVVLVVEYLVLPQLAGTRKAIHTLNKVNGWYLLIGVALEIGSIVAYTQLSRA